MVMEIESIISYCLMSVLMVSAVTTMAQQKKMEAKVQAPVFITKDVNGNTVNFEDYRGQKVMITFYRNVGCPVCNLRFHELQQQASLFKAKGLVLLAIYESSAGHMRQYIEGENFYATMIPNPDLSLYSLYNIERSNGKMMKGMFYGGIGKMSKGKKLFKKKLKQDGNSNRIGADFLINEDGQIVHAYYGKYIGDHLPIDEIEKFIN
jgi:peroxiredoxin